MPRSSERYFGCSADLEEGLHIERSEFLATALSDVGQELLLDYMANTDAAGELPLYQPGVLEEVLQAGTTRGAGLARKGPGDEHPDRHPA